MKSRYKLYKDIVLYNLGGKCTYCGNGDNLHIHHIVPQVLGGTDNMDNLELTCHMCHYDLHRQLNKLYPKSSPKRIYAIDKYIKMFGFNKK